MITMANGEWIADLGAMCCWNITTNMVIAFEKRGKTLYGKIKDMPMDSFSKWAAELHGGRKIKNAVMEAEEVFLRAYFENKIENEEKQGANTIK
jgi:hypothetical protein